MTEQHLRAAAPQDSAALTVYNPRTPFGSSKATSRQRVREESRRESNRNPTLWD